MKSKLHDSFVNGLSNSFFTQLLRTIFSSNSFLQKSRELFFRQIPFCKIAVNYFFVKFLSAKIQGTIFPSNFFL